MRHQSKKKLERKNFSFIAFNENFLANHQKQYLLSIKPKLRGCFLSKYYSKIGKEYRVSQWWINQQVKKACKWIRRQENIEKLRNKNL
jgi:hypothetical protein